MGAFHLALVMHFDKHIHRKLNRCGFDLLHLRIAKRSNDDQNGICAHCAGLCHLPWIDHEILAQSGQVTRSSSGDKIVGMALEIGCVGKDGEARRAAFLIISGMVSRAEIFADETFGRRGFLDFRDQAKALLACFAQCCFETAWSAGGIGLHFKVDNRVARLANGDFLALGGANFFKLVHWRVVISMRLLSQLNPAFKQGKRFA